MPKQSYMRLKISKSPLISFHSGHFLIAWLLSLSIAHAFSKIPADKPDCSYVHRCHLEVGYF